jgi:transcriptional regulator with XRE-family HTH domain
VIISHLIFLINDVKIPTTECKGGVSMRQNRNKTIVALNEKEAHKIVKAMRIYLGMTQEEAARKIGISFGVYAKYENVPGELLKGQFCDVYRILVTMKLDPRKFLEGEYVLSSLGYQVASHGIGQLNHVLMKSVRNCCPVTIKSKEEQQNGSK